MNRRAAMRLFCATLSVAARCCSTAPPPRLRPSASSRHCRPRRPRWCGSRSRRSPIAARCRRRTSPSSTWWTASGAATTARGGTYWEDQTYSDQRVLLHIPRGFDPRRPALMIVFFTATRPRCRATSVNASRCRAKSPNRGSTPCWWRRNSRSTRSTRARAASGARRVRAIHHRGRRAPDRGLRRRARGAFHAAPVVIAAYSGGYSPAAFVLHAGRVDDRLRGVVLFDALYGQFDKFADWLAKRPPAFFVSSFGKAAREENTTLQRMLRERGVRFQNALPANLDTRQRDVPRRHRRRQARRLHDRGVGGRSAQGRAAASSRLRACRRRTGRRDGEAEVAELSPARPARRPPG